jgi:glycosyltransferase involved in cell wall biosynthesis
MLSSINVGIPIIGSKGWLGGISYIELLVRAVNSLPHGVRPKLFLVVTEETLQNLPLHKSIAPLFDGIIFVGPRQRELPGGMIHIESYPALFQALDFYYPVLSDVWPGGRAVSWIPDFQHMYLPQFFSDNEMQLRSNAFARIAADAQLVLFSSNDAANDFHRFFPQSSALTRVLSFYSLPQADWYIDDFAEVLKQYGLPDSFLICCNQIWTHKNHRCLFEAIAALHARQVDLHLVCTGSTIDYREPDYFPRLKEFIQALGIEHLIHIVGNIPRSDQIQLIRRSMAVIQPSLFEGWSTVVEDCRALGKTIILSDLPVHLEQAPRHGVYFDRTSSASLAQVILEMMPQFTPGPDTVREQRARDEAYSFADAFGRRFCAIVQESLQLPFGAHRPALSQSLPAPLVSAIVSTFNSYEFIHGCLESLIAQTLYKRGQLEIVIVDSGSQQHEEAVISEFQRAGHHIRYVKTERETLYNAWNRGIKEASGRYVTNANTDDRHRSDAFEVMCRVLDDHPEIDLVYGDCYVSTTCNETFSDDPKNRIYHYPTFSPPESLLYYQFGPQPMWRKSAHEKIGFFDGRFKAAGDYDFNIRFALECRAHHIPETLGLYLEHSNALSFKDDTAILENYCIKNRYRVPACVEKLYQRAGVSTETYEDKARIYLDMGIRALEFYPPWNCGKPEADLEFALQCLKQSKSLIPYWPPPWDMRSAELIAQGNITLRSLYEVFLVKLPTPQKIELLSNGI